MPAIATKNAKAVCIHALPLTISTSEPLLTIGGEEVLVDPLPVTLPCGPVSQALPNPCATLLSDVSASLLVVNGAPVVVATSFVTSQGTGTLTASPTAATLAEVDAP